MLHCSKNLPQQMPLLGMLKHMQNLLSSLCHTQLFRIDQTSLRAFFLAPGCGSLYPKLPLPPTVQGLKVCLVWTLEKKSWPWTDISHLTLTELVIAITESPCDQLLLIVWHRENLPIMLALCSILLHVYYSYFNASIIHTPQYILLEFLSSTAAHLSPSMLCPTTPKLGY